MKYFTFFLLLFSAVILNAQLNMEEIAYIPSPSGYYNNLVVKGNANINEIRTYPFDVHSYSSFLNLEISTTTSKIYISNLNVSTGTVALFSEFDVNDVNGWAIQEPDPQRAESPSAATIYMSGGNLSVARSQNSSASLNIGLISFGDAIEGKTPKLQVRTKYFQYFNSIVQSDFIVDNLYIMGMRVPNCRDNGGHYYWQNVPVKVNGSTEIRTVLACSTNNCPNPEQEESCLSHNTKFEQNRYRWNLESNPCACTDTQNHQQIEPGNIIL